MCVDHLSTFFVISLYRREFEEMDCAPIISPEIQDLLKQHRSLQIIDNGGKVKCLRSGHEMSCQLNAILQYVNGKKYKKVAVKPQFDMETYKEIIVPSNKPGHEHQLFCTITLRHMNNLPHHIEQHVNGGRFQRAYQRWLRCKETGEKFTTAVERKRERKALDTNSEDEKANDQKAKDAKDDDLSDLYPVEDFDALELSSENEDDSESEANTSGHKRKAKDVSYQVKRCGNQKKTKCSGKTKQKRMKSNDF